MATISKPNTFTSGTIIRSAQVNSNFDTIYNDYNGNITNVNVATGANILGTKLNLTTVGPIGSTVPNSGTFTVLSCPNISATTSLTAGVLTANSISVLTSFTTPTFLATAMTATSFSSTGIIQGSGFLATTSIGTGTPNSNTIYTENIIKAWINFNGEGTIAINQSFNVSSIADVGTGDYTVNWDRNFANTNYCVVGTTSYLTAADRLIAIVSTAWAVGSVEVIIRNGNNESQDAPINNLIAVGNQ